MLSVLNARYPAVVHVQGGVEGGGSRAADSHLDVVVHGGVRGQFLRLLCHVSDGATEQTHVCEAAEPPAR